MGKNSRWLMMVPASIALVVIVYFVTRQPAPAPPPKQPAVAPSPAAPPSAPTIRHPVERQPQEKPLPALAESDAAIGQALAGLWHEKTLAQFFHLKDFVRRIVATIDNLPRQKLALRLLPVKTVGGKFLAAGEGDNLAIAPDNAARYAPYVRLAETVEAQKLVALYVRFYPLFQEAYLELGYPEAYFNDRLVEVIDHLLATPEPQTPPKLVRPKVFYLYADPEQEARSAGQKILMRIGNDHAARIKAKLREIRGEVTRQAPRSR
ncbi:MAG: DUF3014 domain-containing protein [Burkholderiales bacterium]